MLRLFLIFLFVMELLNGFNSKDFRINSKGKIYHATKKINSFLCTKKDSDILTACKKGTTFFTSNHEFDLFKDTLLKKISSNGKLQNYDFNNRRDLYVVVRKNKTNYIKLENKYYISYSNSLLEKNIIYSSTESNDDMFQSSDYIITANGKIRHRIRKKEFLCFDKVGTIKKCKNGTKFYKKKGNFIPYIFKLRNESHYVSSEYEFTDIWSIVTVYLTQYDEWNMIPDDNYTQSFWNVYNGIKEDSVLRVISKQQKINVKKAEDKRIANKKAEEKRIADKKAEEKRIAEEEKKDLIIYINIKSIKLQDNTQLKVKEVLSSYKSDEQYNKIDIRYGNNYIVPFIEDRMETYKDIFYPYVTIKNNKRYSFDIRESLKIDNEQYQKIIIFHFFNDCINHNSDLINNNNLINLDPEPEDNCKLNNILSI